MARMTQQEIFEILMDLHEVSNNDMMKKVYEICLKCLEDITSEITSVEDLPDIPFTNPIKKKLANAFKDKQGARPAVETDTDSNVADTNPTRAPKQGKRKHNIIESSTSTSSTNSQTEYGKRKVRRRRRPRRSSSSSTSSSTSSLPDPSVRNIKCKTCGLWIDAVVFRELVSFEGDQHSIDTLSDHQSVLDRNISPDPNVIK